MDARLSDDIRHWITSNRSSFLIGAGCSSCAGKPLVARLTELVLEPRDAALKKVFANLKQTGSRTPTIEDLINFLHGHKKLAESVEVAPAGTLDADQIGQWLEEILASIVSEIGQGGWAANDEHRRFLKYLNANPRTDNKPVELFSLNYDTLLEASLEVERIPYCDGFHGAEFAWYDAGLFDENETGNRFNLHKLHGSVNWIRDADQNVRRVVELNDSYAGKPVVVYPSEQKYFQTQTGVYETLMARFRATLKGGTKNHLIVLGYSFNDEHINEVIKEAFAAKYEGKAVYAFVGLDAANREAQKQNLDKFSEVCRDNFNAFVGSETDGYCIGASGLGESGQKQILMKEFWKFENLVNFLTGAAE